MVLAHYITRLILNYTSKYIQNIETNNLSLWIGDLEFSHLSLRLDVLQHQLKIPSVIKLSVGKVRHLKVSVPWSSLTTAPIQVIATGVEFVIEFDPLSTSDADTGKLVPTTSVAASNGSETGDSNDNVNDESDSDDDEYDGSSWATDLISKIIANISFTINDFTLRYKYRDVTASLHVKSFTVHSTDPSWRSTIFTDLLGPWKLIHKIIKIENVALFLYHSNDSHCDYDSGSNSAGDIEHLSEDKRGNHSACIVNDLSLSVRIKSYLAALGAAVDVSAYAPQSSQSLRPMPPPCGSAITVDIHIVNTVRLLLSSYQFQCLHQLIQSQNDFYATSAAAARMAQSIVSVTTNIDIEQREKMSRKKDAEKKSVVNAPVTQSAAPLLPSAAVAKAPARRGWTSWMWSSSAPEEPSEADASTTITAVDDFHSLSLIEQRAIFDRDFGHLQPIHDLTFCLHVSKISVELWNNTNTTSDEKLTAVLKEILSNQTKLASFTLSNGAHTGTNSDSANATVSGSKAPFACLQIHQVGMLLSQPLLLTSKVQAALQKHSRKQSKDDSITDSSSRVKPPTFALNVCGVSMDVIDSKHHHQLHPKTIVTFGVIESHTNHDNSSGSGGGGGGGASNVPMTPVRSSQSHSLNPSLPFASNHHCLHRSHYWHSVSSAKQSAVLHALSLTHTVNSAYQPCIELHCAPLVALIDQSTLGTQQIFATLSILWEKNAKKKFELISVEELRYWYQQLRKEKSLIEEKEFLIKELRQTIQKLTQENKLYKEQLQSVEQSHSRVSVIIPSSREHSPSHEQLVSGEMLQSNHGSSPSHSRTPTAAVTPTASASHRADLLLPSSHSHSATSSPAHAHAHSQIHISASQSYSQHSTPRSAATTQRFDTPVAVSTSASAPSTPANASQPRAGLVSSMWGWFAQSSSPMPAPPAEEWLSTAERTVSNHPRAVNIAVAHAAVPHPSHSHAHSHSRTPSSLPPLADDVEILY